MLASILLAACMVPERLHFSEIIVDRTRAGTIAQRLKHESYDTVAKSLPPDGTAAGYLYDIGWITREQLDAANDGPLARLMLYAKAERAAAASLQVGGTTTVDAGAQQEFVHLDEIRPKMICDRAVARFPNDQTALITRAIWELQEGNRRAAVADFSTVIRLDPKSYMGHYGRASAYYGERNYQAALADVNAALVGPTGGADSYTLLGLIEEAQGDDDLATADEAFAITQYRGYGADDSEARYALGLAYKDLGYFAAAIEEFDATLKKNPSKTFAYLSRGFAWFARGDLVKAKADFVAASHAQPKFGAPYVDLAMLSFTTGDAAAALGYAQRALTDDPHDAYAALWVLVSSRALHHAARLANAETFATSTAWPAAAIRVFLGRVPVDSLEAAASSSDALTQRNQLCEARFYHAVYLLADGDSAQALPLLRLAVRECPYREYERATAQQMLRLRDAAR